METLLETANAGSHESAQPRIDQFHVKLEVFEGPFDLLLQLIARKKLDITHVALAEVTDDFIAHMREVPDLSATTEFLVVAATLLDMKAASLLPAGEGDAQASREDLEARDLLFSRLLQYRAFKLAGEWIGSRLESGSRWFARSVPLDEPFTRLLPELVWVCSAHDLARACAEALSQRPATVEVTHLHDPVVPVAPQLRILIDKLRHAGQATFADLVADAASRAVIISRFLAVLELYRNCSIDFTQDEALGALMVIWQGENDNNETGEDEKNSQEEAGE